MILASLLSDALYLYGSALAITVMASSAGWLWRHARGDHAHRRKADGAAAAPARSTTVA